MSEDIYGWSKGGQIFFLDGWAWGIAPNLQRVRVGIEKEVLKALEMGHSLGSALADNILRAELNNRVGWVKPRTIIGRTRISKEAIKRPV